MLSVDAQIVFISIILSVIGGVSIQLGIPSPAGLDWENGKHHDGVTAYTFKDREITEYVPIEDKNNY